VAHKGSLGTLHLISRMPVSSNPYQISISYRLGGSTNNWLCIWFVIETPRSEYQHVASLQHLSSLKIYSQELEPPGITHWRTLSKSPCSSSDTAYFEPSGNGTPSLTMICSNQQDLQEIQGAAHQWSPTTDDDPAHHTTCHAIKRGPASISISNYQITPYPCQPRGYGSPGPRYYGTIPGKVNINIRQCDKNLQTSQVESSSTEGKPLSHFYCCRKIHN